MCSVEFSVVTKCVQIIDTNNFRNVIGKLLNESKGRLNIFVFFWIFWAYTVCYRV